MSLESQFKESFPKTVRLRGESYVFSNRVKLTSLDLERVKALVRGSDPAPYQVILEIPDNAPFALTASCTCPYFEGDFCKHIWATLVALDRAKFKFEEQHTLELYDRREFFNDDDTFDDGFDDFDDEDYDDEEGPDITSYPRSVRATSQNDSRQPQTTTIVTLPPNTSHWQALLPSLTSTRPIEPQIEPGSLASLRFCYVLNAYEWNSSNEAKFELFRTEIHDGVEVSSSVAGVSLAEIAALPPGPDRELLGSLFGVTVSNSHSQFPMLRQERYFRFTVSPECYDELLERMAKTGRLLLRPSREKWPANAKLLKWNAAELWEYQLVAKPVSDPAGWRLDLFFRRGDELRPIHDAVCHIDSGLVCFENELAKFRPSNGSIWHRMIAKNGSPFIPATEIDKFSHAYWSGPVVPNTDFPPEMCWKVVDGSPVPKAVVRGVSNAPIHNLRYAELPVELYFIYGGTSIRPKEPTAGLSTPEDKTIYRRNKPLESKLLLDTIRMGMRDISTSIYSGYGGAERVITNHQFLDVTNKLIDAGWVVEVDGKAVHPAGQIRLSVKSGVDWFELDGSVDFDGNSVAIPALLEAARNGNRFVVLDDGSQGVLPADWLAKYGSLVGLGETDGDTVKFKPSQAMLLDALLQSQPNIEIDKGFRKHREKLQSFNGVKPAKPSKTFQGSLREYQQAGLGWLRFLQEFRLGGCLADDMGLGKTIQVLAMLEQRRLDWKKKNSGPRKPSLVVVPKSLIFNWLEEAKRFTPQLSILNYTGNERSAEKVEEYDVVLTTYGTLRLDIVRLEKVAFDYVIVDESQAIKNPNSLAAKACRLIRADHRLAMTGTPVENHLGELWSLFEFLNPGMLGRSTAFNEFVRERRSPSPPTSSPSAVSLTEADKSIATMTARELLARSLRPYILRRTKSQVLVELPEKSEQTLFCELDTKQRKAYDELANYYRKNLGDRIASSGLQKSKIHVLEALLRLRQAACHPGLLDPLKRRESSAKLEVLLEQVLQLTTEGHKALIFSQFTSLLDIVKFHFDKKKLVYEYLDGQTANRQERVERFQNDARCPLFLISLKAGGFGLNLTAADYVFILDPWWNPAVEAQAIDRTHRIGQTRSVMAYRLIAKGTVEEKILALQQSKRELADSIINQDNSLMRDLTSEDLQMLLG